MAKAASVHGAVKGCWGPSGLFFSHRSCCGQGDLSWHQVQLTGVLLIMVVLMSAHGVAMELGSGAQAHTKQLQSWSLKCKHLQSNSGSGVQNICGIRGLWQPWSWGSAAVALSC